MVANPLFRRGREASRRVSAPALLVFAFLGLGCFQSLGAAEPAQPAEAEPPTKLAGFSASELIRAALDRLDGESGRIQIQGRALSPEELNRLTVIAAASRHLKKALEIIEKGMDLRRRRLAVPSQADQAGPEDAAAEKPEVPREVPVSVLIRAAQARLQQAHVRLQVVGRAHTPEDKARLDAIRAAQIHLRVALRILEGKARPGEGLPGITLPPPREEPPGSLPDHVSGLSGPPGPFDPPPRGGSPADLIRRAIDELGNESTNIQIQGRALTPEEQKRLTVLDKTISHLQKALKTLEAGGKTLEPGPPTPIQPD